MSTRKGSTGNESQTVTSLANYTPEVRKNVCRYMIQLAVNTIDGKPISEGALDKLHAKHDTLPVFELYAVILKIVTNIMHLPTEQMKSEMLKEQLKELMFPEEVISDFITALCGPKMVNLHSKLSQSKFYSKLTRLRWRIDITISTSILSRVLEPTVCFEMILDNGQVVVCELSMAKFHELRYGVATILKEMDALGKRRLVKSAA